MQLFVRAQDTHVMEVDTSSRVADIRDFVASVEGVSANELFVTCGGRPIVDGPLSAFDISDLSTVNVSLRVRGGMSVAL